MKNLFLFLYLNIFNFGFLLCQSAPAMPNIPQINTQVVVNPFDPLIMHINNGNINSVIIELTKGGVINEARREYALNYLKNRIEFWQGRKNAVWKSPDLILALTGAGLSFIGFFLLAKNQISKKISHNENYINMKDEYNDWICSDRNKPNHYHFDFSSGKYIPYHVESLCNHCRQWQNVRPLSEKETSNLGWGGIIFSTLGYCLYRYAKKCPIANDTLSRLINMEYFIKLLPVAQKTKA